MIPLMKNTFLDEYETKRALAEFIVKTDRLSMGDVCFEFERRFAAKQRRRDAVLFNSGGSANLAMLQALKNLGRIRDGDAVGFSALTWSTNVMPIIQMGLVPVPVDCEPATLNVMSYKIAQRLNDTSLRALFVTNALGFAGDLGRIRELCAEREILLLEDNCEALGTELPEGRTGNFGVGASFSFFVAHHMSTIEGGMVATDDDEFAEMLRIVRANGWDRNLSAAQQVKWRKRHGIPSEFQAKYAFYDLGFNLRPTEITGFLGLRQLKYLDENIAKRAANHVRVEKAMMENPDLIVPRRDHLTVHSPFALPVLCKTPELRDRYFSEFSGAGIEIRPVIAGDMQKQPFYRKYVKTVYDLPGAAFVHNTGFYCGNYPELSDADIETLISCLLSR